jgi:hypothetical protein
MSKNSRILVVPDLHAPYGHVDAVAFLRAIKKKFRPNRVICLGDEVDGHALSYHESDPDLDSAGPELEKAIKFLRPIYKMFPNVDVLESNHGSLIYRKAKTAGIPSRALKTYRDTLSAPRGWVWHFDLRLQMSNGQWLYAHHGKSGKAAALSVLEGCCTVEGHYHTQFHATFWRNSSGIYWGLHSGYLADHKSLAQRYALNNMKKGIVGASIILDGQPKLLPMALDKHGRWKGVLP